MRPFFYPRICGHKSAACPFHGASVHRPGGAKIIPLQNMPVPISEFAARSLTTITAKLFLKSSRSSRLLPGLWITALMREKTNTCGAKKPVRDCRAVWAAIGDKNSTCQRRSSCAHSIPCQPKGLCTTCPVRVLFHVEQPRDDWRRAWWQVLKMTGR